MIRAFAALALPEAVRLELMIVQQGLPVPRPVPPESFHLTLVFLGELPGNQLEDVHLAFGRVSAPAFDVALRGLGVFGGGRPRASYAAAVPEPALIHLQARLETAARSAGVPLKARRFVPHVTLARLPDRFPDAARLEEAVALRGAWAAPRFRAEDFRLYRSHLGRSGPSYEELARYPLN